MNSSDFEFSTFDITAYLDEFDFNYSALKTQFNTTLVNLFGDLPQGIGEIKSFLTERFGALPTLRGLGDFISLTLNSIDGFAANLATQRFAIIRDPSGRSDYVS